MAVHLTRTIGKATDMAVPHKLYVTECKKTAELAVLAKIQENGTRIFDMQAKTFNLVKDGAAAPV